MASRSGSGSDGERCSRSCSSGLSGWRKCQCRLGRCGDDLSVADLSDVRQSADLQKIRFASMQKMGGLCDKSHNRTPYLWTGGEHFGDWLGLDAPQEAIRDQAEKILLRLHFMHIRQNL